MANKDAPNGFTPINLLPDRVHCYYKSAGTTIICKGDPVIRATNSADPNGYSEVVRATTGAAITGVVVGISVVQSDLNRSNCLLAAESGYLLVADYPMQEFIVQDNGGAAGIAITDIGNHIDSVAAIDGDTTFGRSNYEIDTQAKAADNTWRIERKFDVEGNDVGANCVWVVKPNLHTESNASATTLTEV
jgi:hypothetical protein